MCLRHKVRPFYFQRKLRAPEWKHDLSQGRFSVSMLGLQSAPLTSSFTPTPLYTMPSSRNFTVGFEYTFVNNDLSKLEALHINTLMPLHSTWYME